MTTVALLDEDAPAEDSNTIPPPAPGPAPLQGAEAALALARLREQKSDLDAQVKALNEKIALLEPIVLTWMMQNENRSSRYSRTTIYIAERLFAKVRPGKAAALAEALQALDYGGLDNDPSLLVEVKCDSRKLAAFVREVVELERARQGEAAATKPSIDLLPPRLRELIEVKEEASLGYRGR